MYIAPRRRTTAIPFVVSHASAMSTNCASDTPPRRSIEPVSDHCGEPEPDRNQNYSHCPLSPWGRSDPVGTAGLSGVDLTIHAPARFTGWIRFDADPSCREGPLSFPGSVRRRRGTARGAPCGRSFGARTERTSIPGMTGTRSRSSGARTYRNHDGAVPVVLPVRPASNAGDGLRCMQARLEFAGGHLVDGPVTRRHSALNRNRHACTRVEWRCLVARCSSI